MTRFRLINHAAALALTLGSSMPALGQGLSQQQVMNACMGDYRRFCLGTAPGGGRILACLDKHMPDLAPQCAQAVGMGQQCVEDYKKFCPTASPQGGELQRCLEKNRTSLSEGCARTLTAAAAPKP